MATDGWGIDDGYEDAGGEWQTVAPETIAAIRAAMGDGDGPPRVEREVKVVRQHESVPIPSGRLYLEDGSHVDLRRKRLPPDLPIGYHDFRPSRGKGPPIRFIVTPGRCPLPKKRLWGWAGQLYAVRSQDSWGIGDLADLRRLAIWAKSHGASFLLVNPLSAASPVTPQQASPYYPASRRFLNPLYLRIEEVPGAASVADDLAWLANAGKALNEQRVIDRNKVFELKMHALEKIFDRSSPGPAFERYCAARGRDLTEFAAFCILAEKLGGDWRGWPSEFQRADSPAVTRFTDDNGERFRFHQWLQWLLDEQLARAGKESALVQDLAIGVDPGGADAWVWQDLYAQTCTVGAPPDLYNRQGQDWGLPPFVPHQLRAAGYEPFIQTLRATLRHSRGLRIDHVMGLFRLYWIPRGLDAARGAFVRYHAEEMLAIVAVESQRAGAFVVGEDLGTVEDTVRAMLSAHRILSYRLLWFEDEPPASYPELSMAAVTTHDLPTVAGLWDGHDVRAQRAIGLTPNEDGLRGIRDKLASLAHLDDDAHADDVIDGAYHLLSDAASCVAAASLDDALGVTERPNMPCTTTQWPNWSLALPGGIEALEESPLARRIAVAMQRPGRTKRSSKDGSSAPMPDSATHVAGADQTTPR